jgi:hypothetical protein
MVLLMRTKSFGEIWSFGENVMALFMGAGRFSKRHKRCIREEDDIFNEEVMDKLLIQMSLLVLY